MKREHINQKNKNKFHENRLQIKKIRSDYMKKEQNSITDLWKKNRFMKKGSNYQNKKEKRLELKKRQ